VIAAAVAIALAAAVCDARWRIIPNSCCIALAAVGAALQAARTLLPDVVAALPWTHVVDPWLGEPWACVAWGVAVLVAGVALELAYRRLRGEAGVGLGDVKYLAAWAFLLGAWVAAVLALACLAGAVVAAIRRQRTFALGPWICAAAVVLLAVPLLVGLPAA